MASCTPSQGLNWAVKKGHGRRREWGWDLGWPWNWEEVREGPCLRPDPEAGVSEVRKIARQMCFLMPSATLDSDGTAESREMEMLLGREGLVLPDPTSCVLTQLAAACRVGGQGQPRAGLGQVGEHWLKAPRPAP